MQSSFKADEEWELELVGDYSHTLHNDVPVNDRPQTPWWFHKIVMEHKIPSGPGHHRYCDIVANLHITGICGDAGKQNYCGSSCTYTDMRKHTMMYST